MNHKKSYEAIGIRYLVSILCLISAGLLLPGCNKNDSALLSADNEDDPYILRIGTGKILTRATDNAFEPNDSIGFYAVEQTGQPGNDYLKPINNHSDNVLFELADNSVWTSHESVRFPTNSNNLNIFAYYPYRDNMADPTSIAIRVETNQSAGKNYTFSDFITATKMQVNRKDGNTVHLDFYHKLSQLTFELKAGDGYTLEELKEAKLVVKNVITDATFRFAEQRQGEADTTDNIQAGTNKADIIPQGVWLENSPNTLSGCRAIVIPQTLGYMTVLELQIGNKILSKRFSDNQILSSGKSLKVKLTANNSDLAISTVLHDWDEGGEFEGNLEEGGSDDLDPDALTFLCTMDTDSIVALPLMKSYWIYNGTPIEIICVYDFTVNWGDGQTDTVRSWDDPRARHQYDKAGQYIVQIKGACPTLEAGYFSMQPNSGLTYINKYITEVKNWGNTGLKEFSLAEARLLTRIPGQMPKLNRYMNSFYNCISLEEIPHDLFFNTDSADFMETFFNCTSLTRIPEDLFSRCTKSKRMMMTFKQCTSIQRIPENLFSQNHSVTNFDQIFSGCTSLKSIPNNLFDNCRKVSSFRGAFYNCTALTGTTPTGTDNTELWARPIPEGSYGLYGNGCFHNCRGLSNYSFIESNFSQWVSENM